MKNLEFNDINGSDNFFIGGVQIDACAGWDDALLVIECKTQKELKEKNLRSYINEFRGKIPIIENAIKNHPVYNKYKHFRYIIATQDIKVRKVDYEYANENLRLSIWNEDFFEYYSNLYNFIRPYAKYDLLGELNIKPLNQFPITIPALQVNFNDANVYTFVMNPKDLLEVSYVARRTGGQGKERFYQRIIDKDRLLNIARYIEKGGKFPNNIIISFREDLKVKFHKIKGPEYNGTDWPYQGISYGILEFPKDYRSCWIIDGQHRLYSFVNVKKDFYFNMPVTAFENLDLTQQRKFFLDINKNQKAVDSDLLWDLSGDVPDEIEGIISNIAKFLNNSEESPLFWKIYYPSTGVKTKKDKIKISAICMAIKRYHLVNPITIQNIKNPLHCTYYEDCTKKVANSLLNYFNVLKENFPNNWSLNSKGFVMTNGGISVMIGLFEKIISRVMQKSNHQPNREDFIFYTSPIKLILESSDTNQLKKLRLSCTSEGGRSEMLNEFITKIRTETKDDLFGGELALKSVVKEITRLERNLGKFLSQILSNVNPNWEKERINEDIRERVEEKIRKKSQSDPRTELHEFLSLGEEKQILTRKDNLEIFKKYFIEFEGGFENEDLFFGAIDMLIRYRNPEAHGVSFTIPKNKEEEIEMYLKKINSCIQEEMDYSTGLKAAKILGDNNKELFFQSLINYLDKK